MSTTVSVRKVRFRPSRRGWILIAAVGVVLSSITADAVASAGRIRSGVRVGALELGGSSIEEAERALTRRARLLASRPATFRAGSRSVTVLPEEVGFFPDVDATLARSVRVGREGSIFVKIWQRVRAWFASTELGWSSEVDRESARDLVRSWAKRFNDPGHEAGIKAEGESIVPVNPLAGRKLDTRRATATLVRGLETWPRQPIALPFSIRGRRTDARDAEKAAEHAEQLIRSPVTLTSPNGDVELAPADLATMLEAVPRKRFRGWELRVRFSPERVKQHLEPRMKALEREPRSASFEVTGAAVVIRPSQDGLLFDAPRTAEALDEITRADPPRITDAAFTAKRPELTTEDAEKLRIHELVSTFTTRHAGGQPRVRNIHRMADVVDDTIVRPGETFSLNRKAGERTVDKGYVLAPMIFDGEYKDSVGGGVSQFATTMFNAVFFGGYDFVSYKPHSYYISRYPAGRDATVSWPAPDFKFKNDSSAGILIKTSYSNTSITISFYGDKEGKAITAQDEPRTHFTQPTEKREPNPSLPPGTERVKQKGSQGFDIVVWRVTTRDGKTTREKFFTRYKAEPRIIEVGPGSPLPGSPAPGSTPAPGSSPTPAPSSRPATPPPATPTPRGPLP